MPEYDVVPGLSQVIVGRCGCRNCRCWMLNHSMEMGCLGIVLSHTTDGAEGRS